MPRIDVNLGPVQQTLLIPLLGRAHETQRGLGLIDDPKAVEIIESLDYDFSKWDGVRSLMAACVRTRMYDDFVTRFLQAHPGGSVVEIGAGLNTRYERLDNGRAQWLELDLPDSMTLRRRFFEETPRRQMLSANVLEQRWFEVAERLPAPRCFVSEAVVIYLDNESAERALRGLAGRFAGDTLLCDTTSSAMVDGQATHDAMRVMPKSSWFSWRCDDPTQLQPWGLSLHESLTLADVPPPVVASLPFRYRMAFRWLRWMMRRLASGYRINRFVLTPPKDAS